jgi:hypothetical protein
MRAYTVTLKDHVSRIVQTYPTRRFPQQQPGGLICLLLKARTTFELRALGIKQFKAYSVVKQARFFY